METPGINPPLASSTIPLICCVCAKADGTVSKHNKPLSATRIVVLFSVFI